MSESVAEMAAMLTEFRRQIDRAPVFLTAVVTGAVDATHMQIDIGGGVLVPAYLPRTIGYCRTGQSVRVRRQENTYTIAEVITSVQWDTDGFTFASGWSDLGLASGGAQRCGWRVVSGIAFVRLSLQRTGGTITASSTGHLADIDVVTIPSVAVPVWAGLYPTHWKTTTSSGGGQMDTTTGLVKLTDLNANSGVSSGNYIATVLSYPLWTTGL